MIKRVLDLAAGPRGPWLLAGLAMLLSLPALRLGFQADDHVLTMQLMRGEPIWSLFRANAALVDEGREAGAMAWWTSLGMHGEFLRPLSSLSHATLHALTPNAAWLMLLVNVAIYGTGVWLAAQLYRKLAPGLGIAALAGLMFAIDDAHAHSVGWISGRNTILAMLGLARSALVHGASGRDSQPLRARERAGDDLCSGSGEAGVC